MCGLPSPLLDDNKSQLSRNMSKPSKLINKSSKRPSPSHEHTSVVLDGRHKRVWKACERCRMKKTKCDGESPCKRCKDDGLVCTAGSRKKTEFKQLPRGYAEVLENTQYALIATVQKLYTMVRNGELWDLEEPELNDRGQAVIHDIASKLGCLRVSPDLPYAFPEGRRDSAELQGQIQSTRSDLAPEGLGRSRKHSEDSSSYSPGIYRRDRASSSESDHSNMSKDYNQKIWWQQQAAKIAPRKPTPLPTPLGITSSRNPRQPPYENDAVYQPRPAIPSSVYTEYQDSPTFDNTSPFSPWVATDEFLGPGHALGLTAHYMRQQALPLARQPGLETDAFKLMQFHQGSNCGGSNFGDGTIRPKMLLASGYETDQQTDLFPMNYESQIGMS